MAGSLNFRFMDRFGYSEFATFYSAKYNTTALRAYQEQADIPPVIICFPTLF